MSIENGWFLEKNGQWPGICQGIQVKEVLHQQRSKYQELLVFESTSFGRVLVLDGAIQLTEKDECSYQEMLAHIPLFSHPEPSKVLIIGGGDGGILREVCKHSCVKEIVHVEIDRAVTEAAQKYFPSLSSSFRDYRLTLKFQDAVEFVQTCPEDTFDVIIVDSSDPDGPAEKLFTPEFYLKAHRLLTEDGVMSTQGECYWIHEDLLQQMLMKNGKPFRSAEFASIQVPTYPCGQICAFIVSKSKKSCSKPCRSPTPDMKLNYYSSRMHESAFTLPTFVERILNVSPGAPTC